VIQHEIAAGSTPDLQSFRNQSCRIEPAVFTNDNKSAELSLHLLLASDEKHDLDDVHYQQYQHHR
jgi:hypothetical protein